MTLAWQAALPHADKIVLLALSDNANDEGHCYPSIQTIATKCGMDERSVFRVMGRLEDGGHLTRKERRGRSSIYRVHPCLLVTPDRPSPLTESHTTPDGKSYPPLTVSQGTPDRPSPITVIEPSIEPSPNQEALREHDTLPREEWGEWLAYRKSKRWPCDATTLKKQLKFLARHDCETQREIIDTSIRSGWQGLFPLKGRSQTPRTQGERRWE